MTHDELLAKIDTPNGEFDAGDPTRHHLLLTQNKALRAVVERCAPDEQDDIDYGIRSFKERILQDIEEQLK